MDHGVGFIHVVDDRAFRSVPRQIASTERRIDCLGIMMRWSYETTDDMIRAYSNELWVSQDALRRLGAAWSEAFGGWAFPMHNDRRQIIGIRLRITGAEKRCVRGSRTGCFVPTGIDSRSMLMICEGPTDTAAALTLGYDAIGRPSCSGGTEIISDILQAGRRRDVVIMADSDGPGRAGAQRFADRIIGLCRSVKIITARPHKDIRDWLGAGAIKGDIDDRIANAMYHRIVESAEKA